MILFFRHKMYLGSLIASLLSVDNSCAQSTYSDFINEDSIELKVEHALNLWSYYTRNSIDSLKIVSIELDALPNISGTGSAISKLNLGSYYVRGGQINKGIELLKNVRLMAVADRNLNLLSDIDNALGNALSSSGSYRLAANYYMSSMVIGYCSTEETSSFNGMMGLGRIFYAAGDTLLAIKLASIYLARSLKLNRFEAGADACAFLGMLHDERSDHDLSNSYYRRSLIYSEESNSISHRASATTNQAILYFTQGQMDSSLMFFQKALELRVKFGQKKSIIESYFNLGEYYLKTGEHKLSEEYYNKSLNLAEENAYLPDQLDALVLLEQLSLLQNDDDQKLSGIRMEIKRLQELIEQNSEIDNSIYSIAMTFEEPVKELFETKSKSLLNINTVGAASLILICLIFLRIDRRLI